MIAGTRRRAVRRLLVAALGSGVMLLAAPRDGVAARPEVAASAATMAGAPAVNGRLVLEVGRGTVFTLPSPASGVFVADPATADVQAQSPTIVYVFGKRAGVTTLFVVGEQDQVLIRRDIVVQHDLSRLQGTLDSLGGTSRVRIASIDGGIVLSGAVDTPLLAQQAREASERFLGDKEILVNQLQVAAPTQISLRVRVAEVSREVTKVFGINWSALFTPGNFIFGVATGRSFLGPGPTFSRFADSTGSAGGYIGGYNSGGTNVNAIVDALDREGLIKLLAEPNLTAVSGETASFLAGGEFPVPVGQDNDQIQIEFKEFGVKLSFTPTVLSPNRISLRVRPEVSELSDQGAIKLGELVIPALATRRADTTIELASGQSFAVGGLLSNSTRDNLEKLPGLGDVPVLGSLFRSTDYRKKESELVIIVTPYIVAPVTDPTLATPVDDARPVSDVERLLESRLTRPRPADPDTTLTRLAGPAGFVLD